ncbi:MAG: glycosyltransferase family 2 protein [Proteobacteria bacterium]|nr:glycosyltransferase [Desulfobacula sp.]MBU3951127.1 glycosyltransferase family 2 protein [Pseudomonadota bacterium]MBU4130187.1 glycosyltransferase family 2 protein [Pseudomonadota bacterium]
MKISVIVPTYNRPDALQKVLDGLVGQTLLPHEIIIADDGSTGETARMLVPYLSRQDVLVHHVWQEDKGFRLSRIRNKAILKAQGEYLLMLDGDCIPERHFVEDHFFLAEKGCFFQGKRVIVNEKSQARFTCSDMDSFARRLAHALNLGISNSHHIIRIPFWPAHRTLKLSGVRGCNMGFFRKDLVAVNGYNQQMQGWGREDQEIVVRLYKYGLRRKENPFRAICYHLWHRQNLRTSLEKNDMILENAIASSAFFCDAGLNQLITDDESKMNEII